MKTVYFVRHGQTEGNQNRFYQHWDTPLSEKGQGQAELVAERFLHIPIDVIIASDMDRANETARAIAEKCGHSVVSEPLFREIYRPSIMRGKAMSDPEAKEIRKFTDENFETGVKHSDEENFFDLKDRAAKALASILSRPESRILVVTHGTFLNMLVSFMCLGDQLTGEIFLSYNRFFHQSNTGITKCEFDRHWRLLNWNDDAHLG
jgi:probable phosphoglycerate mutase